MRQWKLCDRDQREESVKSKEPGCLCHRGQSSALLPTLPGPVYAGALGGIAAPQIRTAPILYPAGVGRGMRSQNTIARPPTNACHTTKFCPV